MAVTLTDSPRKIHKSEFDANSAELQVEAMTSLTGKVSEEGSYTEDENWPFKHGINDNTWG